MIEETTMDDYVVMTLSNSRLVAGILVYEGVDGYVLKHPHYVRLNTTQGNDKAILEMFEYNHLSDDEETKFYPNHVVSLNMMSEHYIKLFSDAVEGNGSTVDKEPDIPEGNNGPLH